MRPASLALVVLAVLVLAGPASAAPRSLELGFFDDAAYFGDPASRATWLDRTSAAGAGYVRITPPWSAIAPATPPAGFDAANPSDPAYRWAGVDAGVREAASRGLEVIFTINTAPAWAEGGGRPSSAIAGSWRPSPAALRDFAGAAARRYDGSFPDPANPGATLPRVRHFQIWNEPNLSRYLSPQWRRVRRRIVPAAPVHYRAMLNAAYGAIKAAQPRAVVATAGTAPYGDQQRGGQRMPPVTWLRSMLCLSESGRLRALRCSDPPRFDAIAHHPYGVRAPRSHALNANDAAVPDVGKLTRVLSYARRARRVRPGGPKRVWVTEISWDSRPPDPDGVPESVHARWLAESLYVLWRQGVDLVVWLRIRDQEPTPSYAATNQSGVYLADGTPKQALSAYRFPFVLSGRSRVLAWGRAPAAGEVAIQRLAGGEWTTLRRTAARRHVVFQVRLGRARAGRYRAVQGDAASPEWRLR